MIRTLVEIVAESTSSANPRNFRRTWTGAVPLVRFGNLVEGHGGDHRRVPDGLQLHVTTGVRALQLDHHEVALAVEREQVDPAARVLPLPVLLSDDQEFLAERARLLADQPLQVGALVELQLVERGGLAPLQAVSTDFVESHQRASSGLDSLFSVAPRSSRHRSALC